MIRFVFFLLLVLTLGLGFAWFADRPGEVALSWQGMRYETSLMVVVASFVAAVAAIMAVWWIIATILRSPQIMRRFLRNRQRDRGYHALSQGLIAAGAGDASRARKLSRDARHLLGGEALVEMLDAQTLLLEGDRRAARERFEAMTGDDDTKLLGLRGLHLEAEREGNLEAARHYAGEAASIAPALPWSGQALLRYQSGDGDWEGALRTLETLRASGALTRAEAERKRAVLLTAQAMSETGSAPERAGKLAQQALKLAPDLVPAALIAAETLQRLNDLKRAGRTLEAAWKRSPHPQIAAAFVQMDGGESASARLKRAEKLAAMNSNDNAGLLAIADAAISAREWAKARDALKPVFETGATRRAFLMMADIEEGETGDRGRARDWLSRAVRAPADPAWIADGVVSDRWLPVSPASGRLDAFEWKAPAPMLGSRLENGPADMPSAPPAETGEEVETADAGKPPAPMADAVPEKDAGPGFPLGRQPDDPGEGDGADKKNFSLF